MLIGPEIPCVPRSFGFFDLNQVINSMVIETG